MTRGLALFMLATLWVLPAAADSGAEARNLMRHCLSAVQAGLAFRQEQDETPMQACVRTAQQRPVASGREIRRVKDAQATPKPAARKMGKPSASAGLLPLLTPAAGASRSRPQSAVKPTQGHNDAFPANNYYLQSGGRDGKGGAVKPIFLTPGIRAAAGTNTEGSDK